MSSKEDNNQITHHQSVDILDSESHDRSSEGQIANNNGATNNGDDNKTAKKKSNPYKQFDSKTRRKVCTWLQLVTFLVAAVTCVASFTVPALRKSRPRGIAMWQWSMLASVLLVGPILSKLVVNLVLLVNDREFPATKENILYYVVELVGSAWVALWFSMILIAWLIVVDEPNYLGMPSYKSEKIIKKFNTTWPIINITLITLILGSFLWLLKNLVLMRTKSSFHIRRFFVRIREVLKHQSVVEVLSVRDINIKGGQMSFHKDIISYVKGLWIWIWSKRKFTIDVSCFDEESDVTIDNVSCWGMKKVIDWMIDNPYLVYEYEVNHKDICKIENEKDEVNKKDKSKIENEEQARHAGEQIFSSLNDSKPEIGWEDIEKKLLHLPKKKLSQVKKCLLEGDESKKIKSRDIEEWMVKAFKCRSSLVSALEANKTLFQALNIFINALLILFIFALWLIMIRVETRRVIFVIATAIVGAAVFCGDTCKKVLENLLFVFVVHPYDIGDDCLIDNTVVKIKEIHVLSTVVLTYEDEIRHYPNSELAGKTISNYTRSLDMADVIEFALERKTPAKTIEILKDKIKSYINNSSTLKPDPTWVTNFQDCTTMKMKLQFRHKINYDDFSKREIEKSKLVLQINEILNEESKWFSY